jgi:hypothetical protein
MPRAESHATADANHMMTEAAPPPETIVAPPPTAPDSAPTSTQPPDAPRARGFGAGWLGVFAFLGLIGVGLYLAWPALTDGVPRKPTIESGGAPEQSGGALWAELDALRARLKALETMPAVSSGQLGAPSDQASLGALEQRLATLEARAKPAPADAALLGRLTAVEQALSALSAGSDNQAARAEFDQLKGTLDALKARQGDMAALNGRLAALEAARADDARGFALLFAEAELARSLRGERAFATTFKAFKALLGEPGALTEPLAAIAPDADTSAPSQDALRARFPDIAQALVRASAASGAAPEGWVDQTIARLKRIVTVRKTGGALEPGSLDERLVRADAALQAGDLAQARGALEGLAGTGQSFVAAWLDELERRMARDLSAEALERDLGTRAQQRFAPPSGASE